MYQKILTSLIVLNLDLAIAQGKPNLSDLCENKSFQRIPNPNNCFSYIYCRPYSPAVVLCPEGYIFHPEVLACVPSYTCPGSCSTGPPIPWEVLVCQNQPRQLLINPRNCAQFIDCKKDPVKIQNCPNGMIFSIASSDCIEGDQDTCVANSSELNNFCHGEPPGTTIPHPKSCLQYITCLGEEDFDIFECKEGYIFDPFKMQCVYGDVETCTPIELFKDNKSGEVEV